MIDANAAKRALTAPEVADLDLSMFDRRDTVNFVLQRSEVLWDVRRAGQVVKQWSAGDPTRMDAVVDARGPELIRRAAAFIFAEFQELRPTLDRIAPRRAADIGCGYGFFSLFLARAYDAEVTLIDIEENEHRHFGYAEDGAAYTSLSRAWQMLVGNGVADGAVTTRNPRDEGTAGLGPFDLITSFVSCGYHYPAAVYADFIRERLNPEGAAILDIRRRAAREQAPVLATIGEATRLGETSRGTAYRTLIRRT